MIYSKICFPASDVSLGVIFRIFRNLYYVQLIDDCTSTITRIDAGKLYFITGVQYLEEDAEVALHLCTFSGEYVCVRVPHNDGIIALASEGEIL